MSAECLAVDPIAAEAASSHVWRGGLFGGHLDARWA